MYHATMQRSIRQIARAAAKPLSIKVLRYPLGIWIFWLSLLYAAYSFAPKMLLMLEMRRLGSPFYAELFAVALPMVAAAVCLAMRRHMSEVFGSISMAFLMHHSLYVSDYLGVVVSLIGFAGLSINRRWFVERLPNVIK